MYPKKTKSKGKLMWTNLIIVLSLHRCSSYPDGKRRKHTKERYRLGFQLKFWTFRWIFCAPVLSQFGRSENTTHKNRLMTDYWRSIKNPSKIAVFLMLLLLIRLKSRVSWLLYQSSGYLCCQLLLLSSCCLLLLPRYPSRWRVIQRATAAAADLLITAQSQHKQQQQQQELRRMIIFWKSKIYDT